MRILQIDLTRFGRFDTFTAALPDGLTILYGENEAGKSTIMDFLQLLFYGTSKQGNDPRENIRKRYVEENEERPVGVLRFEQDGKCYRLTRRFGSSNGKDDVQLAEENSGKSIILPRKQTLGEFLFGLDADAFKRSVYIGSSGSILPPVTGKNGDQLMSRLLNLQTSGEETTSATAVAKTLQDAEHLFVKSRGKGGLLIAQQERIRNLQNQRSNALSQEEEMRQERHFLEGEKQNLDECDRLLREKRETFIRLQAEWEAGDLRRALKEREKQETIRKELVHAEKRLQMREGKMTNERLKEAEAAFSAWQAAESLLKKREKESATALGEEGNLPSQQESFISQDRKQKSSGTKIVDVALRTLPFLFALLFLVLGYTISSLFYGAAGLAGAFGILDLCYRRLQIRRQQRQQEVILAMKREEHERQRAEWHSSCLREQQKVSALLETSVEDYCSAEKALSFWKDGLANRDKLAWALAHEEQQFAQNYPQWAEWTVSDLSSELVQKGFSSEEEPRLAERVKEAQQSYIAQQKKREILAVALAAKQAQAKEKYKSAPLADSILQTLHQEEEKEKQMNEEYQAVLLAQQALQNATEKARHQFSPLLNKRASEIFQEISGREGTLRMDTDLDVRIEEADFSGFLDWRMLSTGTIDQVYFSLRIALAEIASEKQDLPLFFDDAFAYYDDRRAKQAMDFLFHYAKEKHKQVLLFTAHQRFVEWAKKKGISCLLLRERDVENVEQVQERKEESL